MGGKPRTEAKRWPIKRTGTRAIIWTGTYGRNYGTVERPDEVEAPDTRAIAIDFDSNLGLACQVIVEHKIKDGMQQDVWREPSGFVGATWLEQKLLLEVAAKNNTLPDWATEEAQQERERVKVSIEEARRTKAYKEAMSQKE